MATFTQLLFIIINIDNQSAIKFIKNLEYYNKTKHIFIIYNINCKLIDDNIVIF